MKNDQRKTAVNKLKVSHIALCSCLLSFWLLAFLPAAVCKAVSSKVTRHSSGEDLLEGRVDNTVVGSRGTIQLGRAAQTLAEEFEDVWSINSIVAGGGAIFFGTSPNGGIYEYSLGKLTKIYPTESEEKNDEIESDTDEPKDANESEDVNEPEDANKPEDSAEPNAVDTKQYLSNEHIFAMATDVAGRLLAGISGKVCSLMRLEAGEWETVFEPNDAKYIFAIATDDTGDIYLATGPQGKLYKLDAFGKDPQLVYTSRDKNILSLAIGEDGFIYAGSDDRGLVYKINPDANKATVLYDSDQQEITALQFDADGRLYAAATSAKVTKAETKFAAQLPLAGRPEPKAEKGQSTEKSDGMLKLKIANTKKAGSFISLTLPLREAARTLQSCGMSASICSLPQLAG